MEARKAYAEDEVPVGAVLVMGGRIIARGHNLTETLKDATSHAEIQVLTSAMAELGSKYLPDCTLYVTIEPCVMCAGAIYWAKIPRVVYGASEEKYGFTVIDGKDLVPHSPVYFIDGLHPNDAGYAIYAKNLIAELDK